MPCGGQNNGIMPPSEGVHAVIPGIQEYVTLRGRGDFAAVVKLRVLRSGDYMVNPGGPSTLTRVQVREGGRRVRVREDVTTAKGRVT